MQTHTSLTSLMQCDLLNQVQVDRLRWPRTRGPGAEIDRWVKTMSRSAIFIEVRTASYACAGCCTSNFCHGKMMREVRALKTETKVQEVRAATCSGGCAVAMFTNPYCHSLSAEPWVWWSQQCGFRAAMLPRQTTRATEKNTVTYCRTALPHRSLQTEYSGKQ